MCLYFCKKPPPRVTHICPGVPPRHILLHCLNWWWGHLAVSPGPEHVTAAGKLLSVALWRLREKSLRAKCADHAEDHNDTLLWQSSFRCRRVELHTLLGQETSSTYPACVLVTEHHGQVSICDTPRVLDVIQNNSTVDLTLCGFQHPWAESGIYLGMCDSPSPAQCFGIGLCQLWVSRHKCPSAGC